MAKIGNNKQALLWTSLPDGKVQCDLCRHRCVIAVDAFGGQHLRRDQVMERSQHESAGANLVGQGREAERNALAGVALALPVPRLVLAVLLEQDHRQQARSHPAPRGHVEGRGGLRDPLAVPAGELLAHRLDHLPLSGDHL